MGSRMPPVESPLWTDVAGVWVGSVGAVASTVIAVVAVILSVRFARAEAQRAADAVESERRQRRAAFATDLLVWLEQSTAIMVLGSDLATYDSEWMARGETLEARARVLDSPGALDLLRAARAARSAIDLVPLEARIGVALPTTQILKLWTEGWVSDPNRGNASNSEVVIREWVEAWAAEEQRIAEHAPEPRADEPGDAAASAVAPTPAGEDEALVDEDESERPGV